MNSISRILSPIQWAIVGSGVLAIGASLLALPVEIRLPVVLGFLAIVPGFAFVRYLNLDDQLHILLLSLAMSIGVISGVSTLALYAGLWSPNGILIAIGLITIALGAGDGTGARIRTARGQIEARYRTRLQ